MYLGTPLQVPAEAVGASALLLLVPRVEVEHFRRAAGHFVHPQRGDLDYLGFSYACDAFF